MHLAILLAQGEGSESVLISPGTDVKTWERLYQFCFRQPCEPKRFRQRFGVSTQLINRLWVILWRSIPLKDFHFQPEHMLWTLCHLKNYGVADFEVFGVLQDLQTLDLEGH